MSSVAMADKVVKDRRFGRLVDGLKKLGKTESEAWRHALAMIAADHVVSAQEARR